MHYFNSNMTLLHTSLLVFTILTNFTVLPASIEATKQQIRKWLKPKMESQVYTNFRQKIKNFEDMRSVEEPKIHKEHLNQLRKLLQVKHLSMWLQTNTSSMDDYTLYGCHCLPEGYHNTSVPGYGRPVDAADKACLVQTRCHNCVKQEYDECEPTSVAYSFGLNYDDERIYIAFKNVLPAPKFGHF